MGEYFLIQIPSKHYIAKYIQSLYSSPGLPVYFKSNNFFGNVVAAYIEKKIYRDRSFEKIQYRLFDVLAHPLDIYIPFAWLHQNNYHNGCIVKAENAIAIAKLFEKQFEEDLARHCEIMHRIGRKRKSSIFEFAELHHLEIDVDITYDNLKKKEQRQRKKIERRKLEVLEKIATL